MCTLCSQIAPIASSCALGSDVPPTPLAARLEDASVLGTTSGPISDAPRGVGTVDEMAEYLTDGYWESQNFSRFAFADGDITVDLSGLTVAGRQLARWALEAWEMVADLSFREVGGSADITFDDNRSGAFARANAVDGDGVNSASSVNVTSDWLRIYGTGIDSYSFSVYLHEIGHALGLGHLGPYGGNAVYGRDELFSNDSWQMSVMSYFNQTDNPTVDASYGALVSPMMVDIVAIQELYGAPGRDGVTAGNTTWGANTNLENYLGTLFDVLAGGTAPAGFLTENEDLAFTIYDQGGIDTIDLRFSTTDNVISMRGGSFSDIEGGVGNVGIARGTVIENLIAGSGDDRVIGNNSDNIIRPRDGNDEVDTGGGDDLVFGAAGRDIIRGMDGEDTLFGGADDDTIFGGSDDDRLYAGGGDDIAGGGAGDDRIGGAGGNDQLFGGGGADKAFGSAGSDKVFGGGGSDTLFGGDDNDTVGGAAGNDVVFGGDGDDKIWGGGGDGADRLAGGGGNDTMGGGDGADTLIGGDGADRLFGGAGDDILEGGAGNDRLFGAEGADTFVFGAGDGVDIFSTFDASEDRLQLDDALWSGTLSASETVSEFAAINEAGNVVFDFGSAAFELAGVGSTSGLEQAIDIV